MLQYIGARYVPIFYQNSLDPTSSEWESNVTYEPMVWVELSNGHMYISKKTVPANIGSPASNPEYWLEAGQYNAYIQHLQDQIDDMNDASVTGSLQYQINALDTNLQGQIDNINNVELPSDRNRLTALEGDMPRKTAVYFGNSYCGGVGSTSGNDGIFSLTKDMFSNAYEYVGGGVGFLTYTGHTDTFENYLDQAIANPAIENSEVTDLIFLSAWGETLALAEKGETAFINQMNSTLASIKNKIANNFNKKVRFSVALVECRSDRNIPNTSIGTSYYRQVFHAHVILEKILRENNIEYLGWVGFSAMMNSNYTSSDNYHPNDAGYAVISSAFKSAYNGTFAYEPLVGAFAYGMTGLATGSEGYGLIIQTPYETKILNSTITTAASGSTPAQYSDVTWAVLYDTDLTKLSPVLIKDSSVINMGNVKLMLPIDSMACETSMTIQVNAYGQVFIQGVTFDTPISYSARQNNCWNIKEIVIPHYI